MRLQDVQKKVDLVLSTKPETRSNDNILYLEIIKMIGKEKGIDVDKMSVSDLFTNLHKYKFPCMESVRRARQKLQVQYPELRPSMDTEVYREMNEKEYLEYVRRKYT